MQLCFIAIRLIYIDQYFLFLNIRVQFLISVQFDDVCFTCRPLPPIPNLDISEESALLAADEIRLRINTVLSTLHEIAVDGNLRTIILVQFLEISLTHSTIMFLIASVIWLKTFRLLSVCGWFPLLVVCLTFWHWYLHSINHYLRSIS